MGHDPLLSMPCPLLSLARVTTTVGHHLSHLHQVMAQAHQSALVSNDGFQCPTELHGHPFVEAHCIMVQQKALLEIVSGSNSQGFGYSHAPSSRTTEAVPASG